MLGTTDKKRMSIFSDENKVKGNWWKCETVGDKISGTYIGKRQVVNQLSGQDQWIYEIKDERGEYWNIGGKPGIDVQMRHVKPGQIVGFEFKEERQSTKPGMNAAKIVQVYANETIVDTNYVAAEEEARIAALRDGSAVSEPAGPATPAEAVVSTDEKIRQIMEIAKGKWALEDPNAVKQKVMEVTNLAFIESNLDKIIAAIK